MNVKLMKQWIRGLKLQGRLDYDDEVELEIEKSTRSCLRAMMSPLLKICLTAKENARRLLRPLFDFSPYGVNEAHGAILRKSVSLLFGVRNHGIVLCKIMDNSEVRKSKYGNWHSERRLAGQAGDITYTVGLKNQLLIFIAQIQGHTQRFIYSIARSVELRQSEFINSLFH